MNNLSIFFQAHSECEATPRMVQRDSSCLIVVPCFNEGSRLQSTQFIDFVRQVAGLRILFVNDGSRDNTLAVLEDMRDAYEERIQILDLKENVGKAEAVRAGMLSAIEQGGVKYVGFWDADLATPLSALPEFIALMDANDRLEMLFGSRIRLLGRQVHRRAVRHYLGRVFASVASIALRLPIYDTQCGAKVFRVTPQLALVLRDPFLSRWVFDVEILARFISLHRGNTSHLHDSIYEFPLNSWSDIAGSKVRPGDFFKAFVDLLRIYLRYLAHTPRRYSSHVHLHPKPLD
jgi:dolichyl-phosphate beta-glucosyltransferase